MTAIIKHVALVSESQSVKLGDVMKVAAALQKQATRDVAPIWNLSATVDGFERLEDVPLDYWPMIVRDDIKQRGAAGVHLDKNCQPFALITAADDLDGWSQTASHEALEMLVDPFGDKLIAGDSPKADQGRVLFLVEVSDPSEAKEFGYTVNGVLVSDFYTPNYFYPIQASGVRYSYTGAIERPRQVLKGGYLSWKDVVSDNWWQETWFSGSKSKFVNLGKLTDQRGGFRAAIDRLTEVETAKALAGNRDRAVLAGLSVQRVENSTEMRAAAIEADIALLLGNGAGPVPSGDDDGRRTVRRVARSD
jgi:hypothetical protein